MNFRLYPRVILQYASVIIIVDAALQRIETCIDDVRTWMNQNFLKLNDSKTEFMVLGSKAQIEKVDIEHIRIGESYIVPATSVRNLGVMIDSNLTMDCHVTAMSKAAFCSIRNIERIRNILQGMRWNHYPCFCYTKTRFEQFAALWHHKHADRPTSAFAKHNCTDNHIY